MMEYGNVAIMGPSATQPGGLDTIQNAATKLCHTFLFSVVVMLPQLDCYSNCWMVAVVNFYRLFVMIFLLHISHCVDHQD